jgi:predicted nucleotide-binding protein
MSSSTNGKGSRKYRNYPSHTLAEALPVAQKIQDEMGGKPFKRLLLADALGFKPASSNYKTLLSSSYQYGLTEGTEKASEISLTKIGEDAASSDPAKRRAALKAAALYPPVFKSFYMDYADKKVPSPEMIGKILATEYGVPGAHTEECARFLEANGRVADIIRDIGGSPHVLLDATGPPPPDDEQRDEERDEEEEEEEEEQPEAEHEEEPPPATPPAPEPKARPLAIFVAHGKKTAPLEKLQKILASFQIPHKVAVQEATLGRPIPQKVKDTMAQCGSAILIFTRDELFHDKDGNEVWRPSENVVYELGAASFAYEDRVVIFKEKGIDFPTNFQSIGYIEFEEDSIDAKTTDLLKELVGFGLVKITTA